MSDPKVPEAELARTAKEFLAQPIFGIWPDSPAASPACVMAFTEFITIHREQAVREEREENCNAIREACTMCDGNGYISTAAHACQGDESRCASLCPVEEREGCEYCGRPIAAIRARGEEQNHG